MFKMSISPLAYVSRSYTSNKKKYMSIGELLRPGDKVKKRSGNKFLSGLYVNTVKDYTTNEHDPKKRLAYTFEEDSSYVNVDICERA